MNSERILTAPVVEWLDPAIDTPPLCTKILLFTETGVATIGHWDIGFLAWAPLPKQPLWLRLAIDQRWLPTLEE